MSKIRTNRLQARSDDGTITIGATKEDGTTDYDHTTRIIGGVDIEGYASKKYVLDHLLNDGIYTEDIVMKEEAGKPGGYARLTTENIPQIDWYDMKNTIRDNHYDYRVNTSHNNIDIELQNLHQDIITLQGEIESVIKTEEKGVWKPSVNDPPQSGEVQFSSNNFTAPSMIVKVSKTDKDGLSHLFTTADVGEWMEFIEDDADYMLGQIRELDNEDDEFFQATRDVSVGQGDVQYEAGSTMKIRLFEAVDDFDPASIRIVDIAIAPPEKPNNGDLWFDNNSSDMQLRVYQHASEAWIAAAPATTVEDRVTQGEQLQLQIKNEVLKLRSDFETLSTSVSQESPILWKYNSTVPADQLGNGEFNLSANPSNGSADEWSIYFANRDARGQRWFPNDSGNSYSHAVDAQFATIRDRDSIVCHGKTKKWYFNEGNNNHVKLVLTYYRNQFPMANGKYYLITIPGYMPFFPYSSNAYSNGTH